MSSLSMAGHLLGGPSASGQAAPNDIYVEAATGNLIVRLASGTVLTITPAGGIVVPTTVVAAGVDLGAAVAALQTAVGALGSPGPNLLVNGGFEVDQRGGTVTANNAYAHDRWQILLGGSSSISVTDETTIVDAGSGHALKAVYTHNLASSLDQKLESYLGLRGRTLTFAVRVRKGVAASVRPYVSDSGTRTYGTATATTGAYETLSVTLAIGAAATGVSVGVELSASDTVYLDNATLCVGSLALLYTPLPLADDLARCLRYYEVLGSSGVAGMAFGIAQVYTVSQCEFPIFYAEKAVVPTITVSAPADFTALVANAGSSLAGTALTPTFQSRQSAVLRLDGGTSVLVAGNAALVQGSVNARIKIEANP